ncbi:bifunctional UDP-N-acetylmuramoyl-tripeptide:D-alanyl-D-alanine ligase/alanine racemase [Pontibacter akesuensis]|uniref:Alanine racemase n=1 Tax=Pontibacter akesuensis TaxID=388950 RepID=A0A1I7IHT8_9BACT|nr:bifunctional UDP-N-acetylmuramoyl-tripeptide:D-alanyl-D-alanine ligase/alanine racemase [Pontibacter akesuensis]GHA67230.1 bifunctional UDP-N-acetylmuramoyl-tripeptide:D-alanyl-D-alanine ligase/alanine racemase [Pontibacter akesuensis]SFU72446.1 UDP-N-acetylmuramoyl-tripeptide--D-alanyl-D-alanine ligase [Pontibacter akesuensis]
MLDFQQLQNIINGKALQVVQPLPVVHLLTDSRKLSQPAGSVFFAINGKYNDGHKYLPQLYAQGVRQFAVEQGEAATLAQQFPEANILQVPDSLEALQQLAAWHRAQFQVPVIGITGSNGKTIVKEWLSQLLSPDELVVKSPRSYNSQLGVPLSVWQLQPNHTLGIFEAGISQPGEMENLQRIIQPTIGIFTTIGSAHDEGFVSTKQKVDEKLKLFTAVELLFYCADYELLHAAVQAQGIKSFTWSHNRKEADLYINATNVAGHKTIVVYTYQGQKQRLAIPFTDEASIENALHCLAVLLYRRVPLSEIQGRLDRLHPVAMRLEMKEAINGCYLIDDTYNNDLAGLSIALDLQASQPQRGQHTLILSDVLESGLPEAELYLKVAELVQAHKVQRVVGIGSTISKYSHLFSKAEFYTSTADFLQAFDPADFRNEVILVKGARVFEFEKIVQAFQQKVHGTVLEVNLDALVHNLNYYRSKLKPGTKLMVMVKAFAYGSGSSEIANLLQFHRVDYLAVAYVDEGVALRENGITLPIMVMNPSPDSFVKLRQYNLEPEIYSLEQLQAFVSVLEPEARYKIHLKLDTGMHRLGFEKENFEALFELLAQHPQVQVVSAFSHLAGADEVVHNDFSQQQIASFTSMATALEERLKYKIIKHILNSAGIVRFPAHQLDMVRLGIGLYGVEATGAEQEALRPVSTLKTTVSQVKSIKQGETVGYSRRGIASTDRTTATIAIGYADGYDRRFSNGVGHVLLHGQRCPLIGNVCMDMCMVDVTGLNVKAGDTAIVFGPQLTLVELAKSIGTIPYELLTNVSMRVKRVFYAE